MPLASVAPSRRGRQRRHALTLTQYLRFRLGSEGGKTAWFNFFIRPFGASSLAHFWRLWIANGSTQPRSGGRIDGSVQPPTATADLPMLFRFHPHPGVKTVFHRWLASPRN